jgi:hypothetical protein
MPNNIKKRCKNTNNRSNGYLAVGNSKIADAGKATQFNSKTARAASRKSIKARNRKRTFKERLIEILDIPANGSDAEKLGAYFGVPKKQVDNRIAVLLALFNRALKGDPKAFEIIHDTVGEKPTERRELYGGLQVLRVDKLDADIVGDGGVYTDSETD